MERRSATRWSATGPFPVDVGPGGITFGGGGRLGPVQFGCLLSELVELAAGGVELISHGRRCRLGPLCSLGLDLGSVGCRHGSFLGGGPFGRLVIPNKVPPSPPASEIKRLRRAVQATPGVRVATGVSEYRWLRTRKIRRAVTSYEPEPARIQPLAAELRAVADVVRTYDRSK